MDYRPGSVLGATASYPGSPRLFGSQSLGADGPGYSGEPSDSGSPPLEFPQNGQEASAANLSDSSLLLGLDEDGKLETGRSSQLSYHSDGPQAYEAVQSSGEIELLMDYDFRLCVFRITVRRCRNLTLGPSHREACNPYVSVCLLPDKTRASRRKTKVKRATNDPEFHEQLKFNIDKSELESRALSATVWHKGDMFTGKLFLGEISIPLDFCDFKCAEPSWYQLKDQSPNFITRGNIVYRGDLDLAVKYVTPGRVNITDLYKLNSQGELQVWLKGARNLSCCNPKHVCNPRAKMFFLPDHSSQTKRKTPIARRTNNPAWNVILKYEDLPLEGLEERGVEISVFDHDRFGGGSFLGGVRLNLGPGDPCRADIDWMDATGSECRMWVAMLARPDTWIDGTLPLRPQMD